jgi:prephenate dehydrogenase
MMDTEQKIALLGLGLMGSSLGLALKQRGFKGKILAYARREETRMRALEKGVVDVAFSDPKKAVETADLVVVCVPIWSIAKLIEEILPALKPGAIVTDVGSTKSKLLETTTPLFEDSSAFFIGSHPIAGSEKTGIDAGDPELYQNRLAIICPTAKTPEQARETLSNLWQSVGSEVLEMSPKNHDAILAATSHLPHMVAAALARSVAGDQPAEKAKFCGAGFKDTTRVASGSPDMWVDIIDTNRVPLATELEHFHDELKSLIQILREGNSNDIRQWLQEAASARNQIIQLNQFLKK